jgi:hypothetical protein
MLFRGALQRKLPGSSLTAWCYAAGHSTNVLMERSATRRPFLNPIFKPGPIFRSRCKIYGLRCCIKDQTSLKLVERNTLAPPVNSSCESLTCHLLPIVPGMCGVLCKPSAVLPPTAP